MFACLRSLTYGLTLPIRAASVILSHPALIAWSVLPVAVTLLLYGWVITALNAWIAAIIVAHTSGVAAWFIALLAKVLVVLLAAITFSFVAGIAACPFNDFLAEASERFATPPLSRVPHHSVAIRIRHLLIDMGKSVAATFVMLLAFALSFVPGVNVVTFLIAFLLIAFQFISYPKTRRGLGLGDGVAFLGRHFFACLGFGAVTSVLFSIPFVSCLSLPLAVVGGTLLVARAASEAPAIPNPEISAH